MKFKKNPYGTNHVLQADGFYISYKAKPGEIIYGFRSDTGGPETALYKDNVFRILNGDFRSEYEKLAPQGFDACLRFYNEMKKEYGSSWSTELSR